VWERHSHAFPLHYTPGSITVACMSSVAILAVLLLDLAGFSYY